MQEEPQRNQPIIIEYYLIGLRFVPMYTEPKKDKNTESMQPATGLASDTNTEESS